MKKLLLILPITLFLVSCGGGSDDLQPIDPPTLSLEETLVGKKWCLSNEDEDGFILSPDGGFFTTKKCTPHDWEGSWFLEGNLIKYSYTQNSIQTTVYWGEVTEYSATEVKILEDSTSNTIIEKIYYIFPEDIYGCMDYEDPNYNPNANCDTNMCSFTYIPDNNFEQALINYGYDSIIDGKVYKSNIILVESLGLYNKGIFNLTGIQDFTSLTSLYCQNNNLTGLDLSNNTALIQLNCEGNQITGLDLSNNTALIQLDCQDNQITGLDLSNNTALNRLTCYRNQITSLDLSNNTALVSLSCSENQMTSLDVSDCTALASLNCRENQITSLDLSQNSLLNSLHCQSNQLLFLDLKNGNNLNLGYGSIFTLSNPNLTCINVDDITYSVINWTYIDPQHYFSEYCP